LRMSAHGNRRRFECYATEAHHPIGSLGSAAREWGRKQRRAGTVRLVAARRACRYGGKQLNDTMFGDRTSPASVRPELNRTGCAVSRAAAKWCQRCRRQPCRTVCSVKSGARRGVRSCSTNAAALNGVGGAGKTHATYVSRRYAFFVGAVSQRRCVPGARLSQASRVVGREEAESGNRPVARGYRG